MRTRVLNHDESIVPLDAGIAQLCYFCVDFVCCATVQDFIKRTTILIYDNYRLNAIDKEPFALRDGKPGVNRSMEGHQDYRDHRSW